jgi:hypothetical protein
MFFVCSKCRCSCPEALICTGNIHLIQSGESDVSKSLDELSKFGSYLKFFLHGNSYSI